MPPARKTKRDPPRQCRVYKHSLPWYLLCLARDTAERGEPPLDKYEASERSGGDLATVGVAMNRLWLADGLHTDQTLCITREGLRALEDPLPPRDEDMSQPLPDLLPAELESGSLAEAMTTLKHWADNQWMPRGVRRSLEHVLQVCADEMVR